ncbi:hypothetical protein Pla110_29620 [Polystyrenella longa]|uniref:Uncharacterized protein n=1 Tax=Polystyrenella longa TaxID=2528007 RepID=A0A518CPS6_9PLAN|nr:hypothetical protein [Polystyrenella longa]QDU81223.1 hypothetical protein Pla110_29620 [Polystyrenella longa]
MACSRTTWIAALSSLLCLFTLSLFAQNSTTQSPLRESTRSNRSPQEEDSSFQSVLLRDGSVVRGKVLQARGQVQVKVGQSIRSFPANDIRIIGDDIHDIYDRLSHQVPADSSSARMSLVHWCMKYNLRSELIKELRLVLTLDPGNSDARSLLEEFLDEPSPDDSIIIVNIPTKSAHLKFKGKQLETLAGLPAPMAREFTRGVQPIIKKKCGSVSCHGGEQNHGFQLNVDVSSSHHSRRSSEDNFQSIFKLLDLEKPVQSKVFTIGRAPHADLREPLFGTDPSSLVQLQRIYEWIVVSKPELEKLKQQFDEEISPAPPNSPGLLASGALDEAGSGQADSMATEMQTTQQRNRIQQINAETVPGKIQQQADALKDDGFNKDLVNELINSVQADKFDPADFNRRFKK